MTDFKIFKVDKVQFEIIRDGNMDVAGYPVIWCPELGYWPKPVPQVEVFARGEEMFFRFRDG